MMKLIAAALMCFGLSACSAPDVDHYRNEKPVLDLKTYLNGTLDAWGLVYGRSGEVKKRFHVVINAQWAGDTGTLDEHFDWSDGTTSKRVWTVVRQSDGSFRGTAGDVVGEAVGNVAGNALRWRYVLNVPVDNDVYRVDFDDWMFQMDDRVMMNRSYMSKWGFNVGEVVLTFVKRQPS